jgi:hypothetical protein
MKKLLVLNLLVALLLCTGLKSYGTKTWVEITPGEPQKATIQTNLSDNGGFKIEISFSGYYLSEVTIDGSEYEKITLPGAYPGLEAGCPDLPYLNTTLHLPATGKYSARVIASEFTDFNDVLIAPSKGNLPITAESASVPFTFGNSYITDAFYPGTFINEQQAFILRNQRGQAFDFYPFQYNAVTHTLRVYYNLTVEVYQSDIQGENELSSYDSNIEDIREMSAASKQIFTDRQTRSSNLPDENGQMLVICPEEYMAAIQPFVDWKNASGIETKVVDASLFSSAEELRDFIQQYYYNTGNLAYVLLAGDAEQVPTYMIGEDASDNYYGYLAGDDHYPEVYVGRFSAGTVDELKTQVTRTLEYEKCLVADYNYLSAATGIASTLEYGDDNESDFQHIRNLLNQLKEFTYTDFAELYDGSQGGLDAEGYPTPQMATDRFNSGTGVILYSGHGGPTSWLTSQVTYNLVKSLENHGRYPFIWSVACETGNFAGRSCLAEAWLRATDKNGNPSGAVAALMASGVQTSMPPMEAQDEMINQLVRSGEEDGLKTFGGLSASGMISMNNVYGRFGYAMADTWILFGDPSLHVRTKAPEPMTVSHKSYIGEGMLTFDLSANVTNGLATISQNGTLIGSSSITNGKAQIIFQSPVTGDNVQLTVTSFNHVPYSSEIEVMKKPSDALAVTPVNHSKLVPVNPVFEWTAGDGAQPSYYKLFLGTDNPPANLINGLNLTSLQYDPDLHLDYNTTYYWRVESVNGQGNAEGKISEFTTVFQPDEDFEAGMFKSSAAWVSEGGNWTIDANEAFDGDFSGRSGQIPDNGFSSLKYTCETKACDFVSFWRKTSTEGEKDKLSFFIDNQLMGEWSGETAWGRVLYTVTPGTHELEWRYSKDLNNNNGSDAVWLDDIHLPIHNAFDAAVNPTGDVCSGSAFVPEFTAENYNFITWQTNGDGTFDDINLLQPQYTPGPMDQENGNFLLTMNAHGYDGCADFSGLVVGTVNPVPEILLQEDTVANDNGTLFLDGTCENGVSYEWIQPAVTSPYINVDESSAVDGKTELTLKVTNSFGCSSEKTTTVHFVKRSEKPSFDIYPNPCTDYFTIQPENGFMPLNRLYMVNTQGAILWQEDSEMTINGSSTFDIPQLASGLYMLVAETDGGSIAHPILIKP